MKHYVIEYQKDAESPKIVVTMKGQPRNYASSVTALRMARFAKRQIGGIFRVVSRGHEGEQEIFEVE